MVKQLSVWSGDHWIGQKRLIFIRGDPYEWCQNCLWAPKCKEKCFFFFSNSYISGTKWLRHQKWVLNWRFLQELNSKPISEQVNPSRSSGKKEKAWGQICPPLGCPKSAGFYRVKVTLQMGLLKRGQNETFGSTLKIFSLVFCPILISWHLYIFRKSQTNYGSKT